MNGGRANPIDLLNHTDKFTIENLEFGEPLQELHAGGCFAWPSSPSRSIHSLGNSTSIARRMPNKNTISGSATRNVGHFVDGSRDCTDAGSGESVEDELDVLRKTSPGRTFAARNRSPSGRM